MIKAKKLNAGDTIGIFTPSFPGYAECEGLYLNGIRNLEKCGFNIVEGSVTAKRMNQGYRSASPQERAQEFMDLIYDPDVHGLISTIGGNNSSSMIPYLDFDAIRRSRKTICGYSDVTSLHASILTQSGLQTFYGPAVMCWFGDWPAGVPESTQWFLDAVMNHVDGSRTIAAPKKWSNHMRDWASGAWQKLEREWQNNSGWNALSSGSVTAPILALNLNTILCLAGTKYWPDMSGKILLIEDMDAPHATSERSFRQLQLMGVFEKISGLIVSKPEFFKQQNAPFGYDELIMEIVGQRDYPIVSNFDCGHTLPMITVPQMATVRLDAQAKGTVAFAFMDGSIQ